MYSSSSLYKVFLHYLQIFFIMYISYLWCKNVHVVFMTVLTLPCVWPHKTPGELQETLSGPPLYDWTRPLALPLLSLLSFPWPMCPTEPSSEKRQVRSQSQDLSHHLLLKSGHGLVIAKGRTSWMLRHGAGLRRWVGEKEQEVHLTEGDSSEIQGNMVAWLSALLTSSSSGS